MRRVLVPALVPVLLAAAPADSRAAKPERATARALVVALFGDEVLALPGPQRAETGIAFPEAPFERVSLEMKLRCNNRCGRRGRMVSLRAVGDDGREIELARVTPPAVGGLARVDLSRHRHLFTGERTVRILVDTLHPDLRGGWRVDARLLLESAKPMRTASR